MRQRNKGKLLPNINSISNSNSLSKKEQLSDSHPSPLHLNPSKFKQQQSVSEQFSALQQFFETSQERNTILLSQLVQAQAVQTELLKEMLSSMNKSVKIQTASYRMEKEGGRNRGGREQEGNGSVVGEEKEEEKERENEGERKKIDGKSCDVEIQTQESRINEIKPLVTNQDNQISNQDQSLPLHISQPTTPSQYPPLKQFKQTFLTIPLPSLSSFPLLYHSLQHHISTLLQSLTQSSFYGYHTLKQMSKQESSSFFCKNLLHNFINLITSIHKTNTPLWNTKSKTILTLFNQQFKSALTYTKLKFPQKKKTYVSQDLKKLIPSFDNSEKYDTHVFQGFKKWVKVQIADQYKYISDTARIKFFINFLVSETKVKHDLFQMRIKEVFRIDEETDQIVEHVIGSKLSLNTPEYSEEELYSDGLEIKTPQIMRVIVKWIECLDDVVENCDKKADDYFKEEEVFIKKSKPAGMSIEDYQLQRSIETKRQMTRFFDENKKKLQEEKVMEKKQLLNFQSFLPEVITKYQHLFPLVPENDIKIGLFTSYAAESLYGITGRNLLKLISIFQKFQQKKGIPFQVFDLFRAKCSGTIKQIKIVYQNLAKDPLFTIIRVKNRLNTGNRDYLINFTLNDSSLICQLQLGISDQTSSEKQHYYDNFNHFLYELERAKYGPLCEAVNIVSNIEDNISYFSIGKLNSLSKQMKKKEIKLEGQAKLVGKQIQLEGFKIDYPRVEFICSNCFEFKRVETTFLKIAYYIGGPNKDYNEDENIKTIYCGRCLLTLLHKQDIPTYILQLSSSPCFTYVESHEQLKKLSPEYIIVVKQNSRKMAYGYKKYKEKRYFRCMFGVSFDVLDNRYAPENEISIDDRNFFKDTILFVVNEEGLAKGDCKLQQLNSKKDTQQIERIDFQTYQSITKQNPRPSNLSSKTLNQYAQCNFTFLSLSPSPSTSFLLDITPRKPFSALVLQYQQITKIQTIVKSLQKSKEPKWYLAGQYDQQMLKYFAPISNNCLQLYCGFKKMKGVTFLRMMNLKLLKLKLELPCVIQFEQFFMPALKKFNLEMNEGKVENISLGKLQSLEEFDLVGNKVDGLDFSLVDWKTVVKIQMRVNSLGSWRGLEEDNHKAMKLGVIQVFECEVNCPSVDLTKLSDYKIQKFKFFNKGMTVFPSLKSAKSIGFSCQKMDFSLIDVNQSFKLQIGGITNTQDIRNMPCLKHLTSLNLYNISNKQIRLDFDIPKLQILTIQKSLCESILFLHALSSLRRLIISTTKIQSLDVSLLTSLTLLHVPGNNLQKLKFKESKQISQISSLSFDYNYFSPSFFEGVQLKDLPPVLILFPGERQQGLLRGDQLDMLIPKLNDKEFQEFLEECKSIDPTTKMLRQYEKLVWKIQQLGWKEREDARGYYEKQIQYGF